MEQHRFRWQLVRFFGLFLPLVGLSFVGSIAFSKWQWGYFLQPPGLPKRVNEFETIRSITPVSSLEKANGQLTFQPDVLLLCDRDDRIQLDDSRYCGSAKCNSEYCDTSRVLLRLFDRGKLNASKPQMSPRDLSTLYGDLEATNLFYSGESKIYKNSAKDFKGFVLEAIDRNGQNYLFFALTSGQVSNDRYPYYEFLFLKNPDGSMQLLNANRFFYEIAGIEGFEWWSVWFLLVLMSFILSFAVVGIMDLRDRSFHPRKSLWH
ncbi:MAG: hypothetical protein J7642_08995 [Cyanobacteria bacterium SBC]|nr:hypothetical protein [Cyanobacteria bacterium SBC]